MDYAWICRRFLRRLRPDVVVILETELWPNLFREVKRSGASLLLVNGRISDRSFPRYRATRLFWRRVLAYPDALFPQSGRDADRFRTLGAPQARVRVAGNLKFAARPAASAFVETLRARLRESGAGPILVAGSTMPGEEKYLLDAFLQLRHEFPTLFMVLAPRHPERFAAVAEEVRLSGIPLQLRSQWTEKTTPPVPGILLLDSTGELGSMYALATVAFVGGTLVSTGGHNILEPAHFACPTVIGPSMENFREIAQQFLESNTTGQILGDDGIRTGAVVQVQDASGLVTALRYLFANPAFAKRLGESARELANQQLSGLEPLLQELEGRLTRKSVANGGQTLLGHETSVGTEKWQEAAK
jgi:3-deoxy-D-manno-octulosonic-acid transferase